MEKDFNKQFDSCPNCNSTDRFFEQMANELKARGIAREEWTMAMEVTEGVVADPAKKASIPIGSELPTFGYKTDICMDCGTVYAIDLRRSDAKVSLAPAPIIPPNRAMRRRDIRNN